MSDNRARTWTKKCELCGRVIHLTNFMRRTAVERSGALVRTDIHEMTHTGAVALKEQDREFAHTLTDDERRNIYHGPAPERMTERS